MSNDVNVSEGDRVRFEPSNGGTFPTGERTRSGIVDSIRGNSIYVEQSDGFIQEITEDQLV